MHVLIKCLIQALCLVARKVATPTTCRTNFTALVSKEKPEACATCQDWTDTELRSSNRKWSNQHFFLQRREEEHKGNVEKAASLSAQTQTDSSPLHPSHPPSSSSVMLINDPRLFSQVRSFLLFVRGLSMLGKS